MSEESPRQGSESVSRVLSAAELSVIRMMLLGVRSSLDLSPEALSIVGVEDMDDGGMGSIRFVSDKPDRRLGEELARETFLDEDDVEVIATLSLDNYGDLFELDIWKVDFSPVVSLRLKVPSAAS
ncbi:DUF6984 family protein [Stenotrophomonas nematodicola]|uniref:DUF6984 domain-containing protein n=1 Tax=Stenotrophomonas nematodicola TaxID=2656746 RepID=A0ABW7D044_9GAMM